MPSSFKHSPNGTTLGATRTLLYGPVATGVTAVVFSAAFPNLDNTNKVQHYITLETFDGTTYTTVLNNVPVPYGGASKAPKVVLYAGESLYGTGDVAAMVGANVSVLERI